MLIILQTFQLPSIEHVIICRVFIKHLHAFSSSFNNSEQSPLCDFKKRVIFLVQTRIYFFLNQLFHHWPMDLSFRTVLELWLSFIQPWRYFEGNSQRLILVTTKIIKNYYFFLSTNEGLMKLKEVHSHL